MLLVLGVVLEPVKEIALVVLEPVKGLVLGVVVAHVALVVQVVVVDLVVLHAQEVAVEAVKAVARLDVQDVPVVVNTHANMVANMEQHNFIATYEKRVSKTKFGFLARRSCQEHYFHCN